MNLASKYRPHTFEDVTEQSAVVDILQKICHDSDMSNRNYLFIGPAGTGKAQPLDSKVLTPSGYIKMRDVAVGTRVLDGEGNITTVIGVYPQGERPCYKLEFDDGCAISVADNHLNVVTEVDSIHGIVRDKILTTSELLSCSGLNRTIFYYVPIAKIPGSSKQYCSFIDPYFVGAFAAAGQIKDDSILFRDIHLESIARIASILSKDWKCYLKTCRIGAQLYYKVVSESLGVADSLLRELRRYFPELCVGERSFPEDCILWEISDREQLLEGMRCDSYNGCFVTSNIRLSMQYTDITNSLGRQDLVDSKFEYVNGELMKLYIHSSSLVNATNRQITCISPLGDVECQCIMVESSAHTYITDHSTVTHNTTLGRIIASELNGGPKGIIEIDAASHSGADAARDIANQSRAYPVGTNWKCFLIDECHAISSQGWQVLLKTLEESPAKSIFILCVDKDGFVNTDQGLKRIQDVETSDKVWDGHTYRTVLGKYDKGVQSAVCVQFDSGNVVKCTPTHKFKVLSGDSEIWKSASDIRPGDVLLRYNNVDTSKWGVDTISDEEAFFIGYLTGNGNYDTHSMHLYTPYHKWSRLEAILDALVSQGVIRDYVKDSDTTTTCNMYTTRIHFPRNQMNGWYAKVGADPTYRRGTKTIPKAVFNFSTAQFKAFVDGWYFADGCGQFDTFFTYTPGAGGSSPFLYCSNRQMITDLSHLLESHGYYPSLRTSVNKGEYTPGRSLPDREVTSFVLYLLHKPGYFHNAEFRKKLQNIYSSMPMGKYKYDLCNLHQPNRRISPTMLDEAGYSHFNDCGYFDTVSAVTACEPCHVYDIEVETSHSFIYNGICAHNCTTNPEKIPGTILSRVQTFQLSKISVDGVTKRLKHICDCEIAQGSELTYEESALRYIAKLGNGGMRDSIQLLDRAIAHSKDITLDNLEVALDLPNYDNYFALLNGIVKKNNEIVVKIINDVYDSGTNFVKWFEGFHSFVCQIVKYIYLQDINKTMIPAHYQDKIANYGSTHAILCLRLSNTLLNLNHSLKSTNYLQEVAITYLCSSAKR